MADAANAPTAHRGGEPASSLVLASAPASARSRSPSTFTPATPSSAPIARSSSATAVSSARTTGSPDPAPFAAIRAHPRRRLMRRRVALGTLTHTLRSADAPTAVLMVLSALSRGQARRACCGRRDHVRLATNYNPRTFSRFFWVSHWCKEDPSDDAVSAGPSQTEDLNFPRSSDGMKSEGIKSGRFLAMRYTLDTRRRARDSPSATRTRTTRCRRS